MQLDTTVESADDALVSRVRSKLADYLGIEAKYVIVDVLAGSVIFKITVVGPIIVGPLDQHVRDDLIGRFEDGSMQRWILPDVPIAHVNGAVTEHWDYGLYWTGWYNVDSPQADGNDAEVLHVILRQHDACGGAMPLGVNCQTLGGVHWSDTGQNFSMECGLAGIEWPMLLWPV